MLSDTIVAIATPPGRGGLGVVRLSGPAARLIAEQLLRFPANPQWTSWRAQLAQLVDPDGQIIDEVVATCFAAPRSYTAEDVIEISCHGAPVVLGHAVERALQAGARLANPGEFTLRAYMNGRLDLPQAEAVRDLIEATTLYQARIAAQQVGGALSRRLQPLKSQLVELISLLEAGIDFAEDDVEVAPAEEILRRLAILDAGLQMLARSYAFGKYVHQGVTLAVVGRPNVGKSSLFNRLLEQDRAIVTDIPGTTRDLVSESMELRGIPVRLLDTAGIRDGQDLVERLGIERSRQAMADADVTLLVLDFTAPLTTEDEALLATALGQGRHIVVGNKSDGVRAVPELPGLVSVSAHTGAGIEDLRNRLWELIAPPGGEQQGGFLTSLRHAQLLRDCLAALAQARVAVEQNLPHEMLLIDLYSALRPLDAVTGATTADDILNRIFATFCIGK